VKVRVVRPMAESGW